MEPVPLPPPPTWDPFADPIAAAVIDEVVQRGYAAATVAGVIARAGIDRVEFERRFADLEDCALRSYEAFIADYERRVGAAYNGETEWRTALRAAAYETADWMETNPNLVRFGTVEVLEMRSEMARVRREEVFVYCARLIDGGRAEAADPSGVPDSAAIVAIGSIMQLLTHRVQKGAEFDPHSMVPELMYAVVRPYRGEEVAREELTMPRPRRQQLRRR
jgi:AcrR family transcriptional regulator